MELGGHREFISKLQFILAIPGSFSVTFLSFLCFEKSSYYLQCV